MKRMGRLFRGVPTAFLLLSASAATADQAPQATASQPSDSEAMRAELRRLREELEALKAARPEAAAPGTASTPAKAGTVEERLDLVEVKQEDAVVKGDIPGAYRVPGTDISLRVYGLAELNWNHDFEGDNTDLDYATFTPYTPLENTPAGERKHRNFLTARTSRIGIAAGIPTRLGLVSAKIEADFSNEPRTGNTAQYGSPRNVATQQQTSSYGLRVRHAYGQFGGLLIGQNWSTFMDVDNYPETVDFNGPVGATISRQPQIRYSYATQSAGTFTAALENSASYVLDEEGGVIASSLSRIPDVVLRWDKSFEWGATSVRGVTQELHIDDGEDQEGTRRGWGAAVSALVKLRGKDVLTLGVTGGEGIGRYLNYIEGAIYDAEADEIQIERALGILAGYQFKPTSWVRINLVYGMTRHFDNEYTDVIRANGLDAGRFGVNRWVQQANFGPIFSPVKEVDLGLEAIWGTRKTLAAERGYLTRLNFMARYYIN
jgi:hypothetical protein